jgi:F420-dependent oxidoreductase-like protein
MRLGLLLRYRGNDTGPRMDLVEEAERLGYDSVWSSEAYGTDAVTPISWVLARTTRIKGGTGIMQIPARTPSATAMAAATLDHLTQGRMLLGIGASGPQVAEGWYGQEYGKPLKRTREYVEIVRTILRREDKLEFHGEYYDIPVKGGTGLGKPLKLITKPFRPDIPIYLAAIGPKNVALAAEIADGWLPVFFSPYRSELFTEYLDNGFEKRGERPEHFDIAAATTIIMGDDVDACRDLVRPYLSLYIGGMGARGKNFYNDLACRMGYEAAAKEVQDLYLDGKKQEAGAAIPDELIDEVALCGPRERIVDRLGAWKESPVTTLCASTIQTEVLELLAEECT